MSQFDEVIQRQQTNSVKWDLTAEIFGRSDVLPMWVADMDFKAPPEVLEALNKRIGHGVFGYSSISDKTKNAVMEWSKKRNGWSFEKEAILFSPGVVTALSLAIQTYSAPGEKILLQSPVYTPFFDMVKRNGRIAVNSQLILQNGRYEIDFDDLDEKMGNPDVKLMLLCNPHNPGGRSWKREELIKIGQLAQKHDVLIVSDEIHSDMMLFGNKHVPFASISKEFSDLSITCFAPSKTFNLAGLQASIMVIENDSLRRRMDETLHRLGFFTLNALGSIAMETAYRFGGEWLTELTSYLEKNINYAMKYIQDEIPGIKAIKPDASYLLWLDCRDLHLDDKEIKRLLLHKGKVALEEGTKYGPGGEGFVRLNAGCPLETLKDGLSRIKTAFHRDPER
ncbi:pyridoxal phosphate-dependent aminotransferase [Bacillus sp. FJAT-42376]|uniref:MalY/PatB family protein n=1 Tax=Bacillus sp. FJAT-42376 TaxID=2014076 RepID=UPI000F50549A|nr:MalY/PatB family protein [Bacillus sp. FJAT-42376]AZB44214.1 pyridoxal phosphate-dependent aminotransferase [Bacillus sp. FJAT-42376]